jgi:catechol 2,3-dioxygenase-like lactoylglutathione lyase family enzyme
VEEELRAELQERHGRSDRAAEARGRADHDRELEPVVVPVTDMDRAEHFYGEQLGFVVGHDTRVGDEMRVVQLSPPGSVEGLQLAVPDLDAARARLVEQGVEVSQIQHYEGPTGSTAGAAAGTPSSSSGTPTGTSGRSGAPAELPVSSTAARERGGTGRRAGFRSRWGNPWGFESPRSHTLPTRTSALHLLVDDHPRSAGEIRPVCRSTSGQRSLATSPRRMPVVVNSGQAAYRGSSRTCSRKPRSRSDSTPASLA